MIEMPPHVPIGGRIWDIVVLLAIWTVVISASAQQTPAGFISIDCGNTTQYQDSLTNLTWEADGKYTPSGMDGVVPNPPDSNVTNFEALRTFRYFPRPQNKYCYDLRMASGNISVLIRAMFLHGNSSLLVLPIRFKVYVNATLWSSVQYGSDESLDVLNIPKVIEGILYFPGNVGYVCLVPDQGVPFISSLELRQFDHEGIMYSLSYRKEVFLSTLVRYDLGAPENSTVRYPDDAYDRLWNGTDFLASPENPSSPQTDNENSSSKWNHVPPRVMMNAISAPTGDNVSEPLTLPVTTIATYVHAIFYCEALNNTEVQNMVISMDDEESPPFDVTRSPVMIPFDIDLAINTVIVGVSSLNSSSTPIANAMEIYEKIAVDSLVTSANDVLSMSFLKITFNLSYWQGDPCLPVPYHGVTCVIDYLDGFDVDTLAQRIESINLSKLNNSARLRSFVFPPALDTLADLESLSITDSHIDDDTFRFIMENLTANSFLQSINLSYNDITMFPSLAIWYSGQMFDFIDLSHNSFSGEVLSFGTFNNPHALTSLTKLNLSYNSFTSFPNYWGNSSEGLLNLIILDVSHNSISSNISSLNKLLTKNPSLEEIYLSDNELAGPFPSDLYFLKHKRKVNVNRNNITGLLNLIIWYEQLQSALSIFRNQQLGQEQALNHFNSSLGGQLYSFVDNDILDIFPSADAFQPVIEFMMRNNSLFNQTGVLLHGNPYCKNAKSLTQRYLCRSTIEDIVYDKQKVKVNVVLTVFTTLGGISLLLLSCIVFMVIWRLWRKLSITSKLLREVQQELTNRKVQPPFYSYHDLRVATKGFHEDNKLGTGTFGAVYKAILSDGSTVAVKRLFNSDKAQVLNEFLSEVALISGIKHKHLVQLKGCCIKDEERILVYEFAANGNLAEALWGIPTTSTLDWSHRLNVAVGVARGLSYLHEELQPRIIHRDIKAVNVLLDDNYNAKIADFGLAKSFAEGETQAQFTAVAGTRGYFAPEYVLEGQLTIKADVFSFGILLLEILTGRKCIDSTLPSDRVYIKTWAEDLENSGTLLELLPPKLRATAPEVEFITIINVALSCIRNNPKFRPTMSQVVIMLLGNLEAQNFWKLGGSNNEYLEVGFSLDFPEEGTSTSSGIKYGRSGIIHEDSENNPLIRSPIGSQSFPLSILGKSRIGNAGTLQLSHFKKK